MKPLAALSVLAVLVLSACGETRPEPTSAEKTKANQTAADQMEKSFDKEAPADPAALK